MRKFTLFIAFLFLALGAMAQITDLSQLSNYKCYHITSKDGNRGAFYAKPGEGYLSHCGGTYGNYLNKGVAKDPTSSAQQFAFVKYDDKLYLYSVSEKKFAQKDGNFIKLVKTTTNYVTVVANGNYFNIKINGTNKLNFSGGYTYGVYANYNNDDDGNNLVITEAGDFDPTEAIRMLTDPLEENMTLNWTTSTNWTELEASEYTPTVFVDDALTSTTDGNNIFVGCIEIDIEVGGARTASMTFTYTSGACALNILGVEVVNTSGQIVAGDYHCEKAGGDKVGKTYTVSVAERGTYKVRCYATFDGQNRANETNGNIALAFAYPDVAAFSHNVTFAAEYATLYLGYKVAVPNGVEAYVVKSTNNGHAQMEKIEGVDGAEGVIPANTAVILKKVGNETAYTFAYTAKDAVAVGDNLLNGSIANCYVAGDAYVLTRKNGEVYFGGVLLNKLDGKAFLNNANKVYLPKTDGMNAPSYSFRFPGTTDIENVEVENEVKAIYDLTGRKVDEITAPGIYIVNGKKTLVK